ncbi:MULTISPECIES: TetR family transcriptional regulator C-terminal domain-containing protein [Pseudomonas]|uniref:TetR family transcriptional regulator C-terminal domain-containing protein n=1 Tax=Pseudomonas nitroreducens TaxID=46680 RepID=A0ABS0KWS2_PSENT|nr:MULTISPECIES: TetR family transcriptional regulator C-terminal domain-containing protein [Pseudomonas]MBG6291857.1 TetR family transcriptional regulator C-terminal domain-containing protein [Pseudomonas nitroreducens]MCE4067771.1 TetR family transcriptional regulator C-terminal domain-containing protein [Pseudomonas nitritireducens]MCE4076960.1 TetR family transcriptional regulator C-terminal domain-containing protein [Pseudomonas nitroreducens]MCJ1879226.1 TetR family transcriptional regula
MNEEVRFTRLEPEQRKALLIEATLACLKRHGFQGASIRKICAEAGVSVGLINHHYSGKDELVAEAYLTVTGRVMQLLREAIAEAAPDARARLSAFFRASFCAELLDPQLLDAWLAFWGAVKTAEAINQAHDHSYGEYRTLLAQALKDLAQEQAWSDFDADLAAIALSALLDGLWLESGLNPNTFTPEQGVQICEAWVDGLQHGGRQRFSRSPAAC